MEKKRVFVTGVAGFLGSHLAERLLQLGHDVLGCDDLSGGDVQNIPKGVEFFEYDLRDFYKNLKSIRRVDVVFHGAAHAHDGLSVFSPHSIGENIYSTTSSVLTASIENGVERFIFCSSMARYGDQEAPFVESMETRPITPYGIAKVAGEQLVKNMSKTMGIEYSICVPHNIIGPKQKFDDPFRNVAAIMMNRMLQGKQPVIYGDGQQKRCFSYVDDCIQVMEKLVVSSEAHGLTVNVGPDEDAVSVLTLAETIADILNFSLSPIFIDDRLNEVKVATCSSNLARRLFNYRTEFRLRQGLEAMAAWMTKVGPRPFEYHMPIEIHHEGLPKSWQERVF